MMKIKYEKLNLHIIRNFDTSERRPDRGLPKSGIGG